MAVQPDVLHDGVPAWLVGSLIDWLRPRCYSEVIGWGSEPNPERIRELERRLHLNLGQATPDLLLDDLLEHLTNDEDRLLRAIGVALGWYGPADYITIEAERDLAELENAFRQSGSAWQVAYSSTRGWGLERRVDETTAEAARVVMSTGGRASDHLAEAWRHLYARDPSPGEAYAEAVKAVEAAAIPVVCPNDSSATLGKIIGQLRAALDGWALALEPHDADSIGHLCSMLDLLWRSQRRHGTPDPATPLRVSPGEAEPAVYLAITLVHWFTSGAVQRV